MTKLVYTFKQSLRIFTVSKVHTLILLVCYTAAFLLPVVMQAYKTTQMDSYSDKPRLSGFAPDFSIDISNLKPEQLELLGDCEFIRKIIADAGLTGSVTASFMLWGDNSFVLYNDKPSNCYVLSTTVSDGGDDIRTSVNTSSIIYGRQLSPNNPYEVLVGDHALEAVDYSKIVGNEIVINGNTHIIVGVLRNYRGMYTNVKTREYAYDGTFQINAVSDMRKAANKLADELEKHFEVGSISYSQAQSEVFEEQTRSTTNFYLLLSLLGYLFCVISTFSIIHSVLYDNRKVIGTKLSIGANALTIAWEFFIYFLIISITASGLSTLLCTAVSDYYANISIRPIPLMLSMSTLLLLLAVSVLTSMLASLYAAFKAVRRFG